MSILLAEEIPVAGEEIAVETYNVDDTDSEGSTTQQQGEDMDANQPEDVDGNPGANGTNEELASKNGAKSEDANSGKKRDASEKEADEAGQAGSSSARKSKTKRQKTSSAAGTGTDSDEAGPSTSTGDEMSGSLAPIPRGHPSTLPAEIWKEIFAYADENNDALRFVSKIAWLTRQWRDMTLDEKLWRRLDLSKRHYNLTEDHLIWLADNRLAWCWELNISSWRFMTCKLFQYLVKRSPNLRAINVSRCPRIHSRAILCLTKNCPRLTKVDISFTHNQGMSMNSVHNLVKLRGGQLTYIDISGLPFEDFNKAMELLIEHCPMVQVFKMSFLRLTKTGMVHAEKMHKSWTELRVLQMVCTHLTCVDTPEEEKEASPGFPKLEELNMAKYQFDALLWEFDSSEILFSFTHKAKNLRILDLRGCAFISTADVITIDATGIEELYMEALCVADDNSFFRLMWKYQHSLKVLNLTGTRQNPEPFLSGLRGIAQGDGAPNLHRLGLCATNVDTDTLMVILPKLTNLESLDLHMCHDLPPGIFFKVGHEGRRSIERLQRRLALL